MGQSQYIVSPLARQLIEQCQREIAAGWEQIEAGRRILARSRWLLQRWAKQARAPYAPPVKTQRPMGGTFEPVESETPRERLRRHAHVRFRLRRIARAAKQPLYPSRTSAGAP
jgi:hypothetical protein